MPADLDIAALLARVKWGGAAGLGASVSYSFPWLDGAAAVFSGYNGAPYSSTGENAATYHFGLTAVQQAAARGALAQWSDVANLSFQEVADTSTNVGDIRFAWTSASQTVFGGGTAWGWGYYPNSYWPQGGDVWLSTQGGGYSDPDWSAGSYNYLSLIHEIGHALGLKHPFEGSPLLPAASDNRQYTVMSYTDAPHSLFVRVTHNPNGSVAWNSFSVEPHTPMLDDIAAMQHLHGANLAYHAGDDVYTFDPSTPFFRTLWDAGGNDTISVANFSAACVIDLWPGDFSKIAIASDSTAGYNWSVAPPAPTYDGTDNLAIAYGAVIENAVGGAGNDSLYGNDASNHLDGGAGDDVMYGGPGDDWFDWDSVQRAGADRFYGGPGDDVYVLSSTSDQVVEAAGEGNDTIWVEGMTYSLAGLPDVENLYGFGAVGLALAGNAGGNLFVGTSHNDTIDGGAGVDAILYGPVRASFSVGSSAAGLTVVDMSGAEGTDLLTSVERLSFADQSLAFDLAGNAGMVAKLLGAVFGAGAVSNLFFAGLGLQYADGGMAYTALAQLAIDARLGAGATHKEVVDLLYSNIMGSAPPAAIENMYRSQLDSNALSVGALTTLAADTPQNTGHIGLAGLAQSGLAYLDI